jgi:hypothetical protein
MINVGGVLTGFSPFQMSLLSLRLTTVFERASQTQIFEWEEVTVEKQHPKKASNTSLSCGPT